MSTTEDKEETGAFVESLKRNNTKIRSDRAASITEDTQLIYKRTVEDLRISISKMERELENMLDLSPSHAQSLILASDFDAKSFVDNDVELAFKIRNSKKKLEVAEERYTHLFGDTL